VGDLRLGERRPYVLDAGGLEEPDLAEVELVPRVVDDGRQPPRQHDVLGHAY
jgi:hypothetical protein